MARIEIRKLGYYSPSQNGVIIAADGCAPCVCGGGHGHDTDVPKILVTYGSPINSKKYAETFGSIGKYA